MFLARTFSDARNRLEEDLLAKVAHLVEQLFESAMVGNGFLVKVGLRFRQGDRYGSGLELTSPTPSIGRFVHEAALGDPPELKQLFFKLFITLLDPPQGSRR